MAGKITSPLFRYENKWVATSPDGRKVVASGKTIEVVTRKLNKLDIKKDEAVLTKVVPFNLYLSP